MVVAQAEGAGGVCRHQHRPMAGAGKVQEPPEHGLVAGAVRPIDDDPASLSKRSTASSGEASAASSRAPVSIAQAKARWVLPEPFGPTNASAPPGQDCHSVKSCAASRLAAVTTKVSGARSPIRNSNRRCWLTSAP